MTDGFTDEGLAALDAALAGHASSGAVPGLVALVARDGQVHVTTAGHLAAGDREPIGRDAIFRIASLTKPVVGAAAMLLIQDGDMTLDDQVDYWLPELSGRRVLRSHDAELSDTVLDIAHTIAGNAPLSIAASKLCINMILRDPADRDLEAIERAGRTCLDSADYREGRTAFMEKRKPRFSGR